MAEKALFEYRAEREEGGYRREFRSGCRRMEYRSPTHFGGVECMERGWVWMKHAHQARCFGSASRRTARKALDVLEGLYRDIYGSEADEFEEAR